MYGFSNPKCIKGDELIKGKGFLMLSEYVIAALFADLKILIKHILFWGELKAEIVTPIDSPPPKMTYRWRTDCLLRSRRWLCTFRIAVTSCQFWDQDRVLRVTYPRHQEAAHSPKSPTSTVLWDAKTCSNQPITWLGAVFCTIFCFVIFLGGLIVLIVYCISST